MLAVVIATAAAAVFVCGLIPALQASDVRLPRALRIGSQLGVPTVRTRWLMSGFLTLELGLALVLVTNVAMAMQGARNWQRQRVIDPAPLLTAAIALPGDTYGTPAERVAFYATLDERLRSVPGVDSVAVASHLPLIGGARRQVTIEGRSASQGFEPTATQTIVVSDHYFETVGLSVVSGRTFNERDGLSGQESVLVNQRFADVHFPGAHCGRSAHPADSGTRHRGGVLADDRRHRADDPAMVDPTKVSRLCTRQRGRSRLMWRRSSFVWRKAIRRAWRPRYVRPFAASMPISRSTESTRSSRR